MSGSEGRFRRTKSAAAGAVAGNGLMDRRALLGRGVVLAGAMSTAPLGSLTGTAAERSTDTPLSECSTLARTLDLVRFFASSEPLNKGRCVGERHGNFLSGR